MCEQSLEEIRRVFTRKLPGKIEAFERFLSSAMSVNEVVPVPSSKNPEERSIRDPDGRPILRAAIKAGVDYLVTGDKDFLESGLKTPQIMTAAEFMNK